MNKFLYIMGLTMFSGIAISQSSVDLMSEQEQINYCQELTRDFGGMDTFSKTADQIQIDVKREGLKIAIMLLSDGIMQTPVGTLSTIVSASVVESIPILSAHAMTAAEYILEESGHETFFEEPSDEYKEIYGTHSLSQQEHSLLANLMLGNLAGTFLRDVPIGLSRAGRAVVENVYQTYFPADPERPALVLEEFKFLRATRDAAFPLLRRVILEEVVKNMGEEKRKDARQKAEQMVACLNYYEAEQERKEKLLELRKTNYLKSETSEEY